MSTTLTWFNSGLGTKTGATSATFFDDLDTLVTSKAGDANFSWQKAGKNSATSPMWILLSRKDGSNGRIALIHATSGGTTNGNTAIFDGTTSNLQQNNINFVYFPNGTANTLSNITTSGTVCGNDTGVVKAATCSVAVPTAYAANFQLWYFDCYDGLVFGSGNPAVAYSTASSHFLLGGAGDLVVDGADTAYGCTFTMAGQLLAQQSLSLFYQGALMPWAAAAAYAAGTAQNIGYLRTNYGAANRIHMQAFGGGSWAAMGAGSTDILSDATNLKVWFVPIQLLGTTKGEGFALKLRQIGLGPGTTTAFAPYNSSGGIVKARQFNEATAGAVGYPWMTNFKL